MNQPSKEATLLTVEEMVDETMEGEIYYWE